MIAEQVHGGPDELVPERDPRALAAAIPRIAAEPDLRRRYEEGSRRLATERFGVDVIAEATRAQYERLLEDQSVLTNEHARPRE